MNNGIGTPFSKGYCSICDKFHRHFTGLRFERENRGFSIFCENCREIHKIGFNPDTVNLIFLGSSTFHNAHMINITFKKCITFDTICGGRIENMKDMYIKYLQPLKNFKFRIIVSIGLNDFHRKSLAELKQEFKALKFLIEGNPNHTLYLGTLLKAPKLLFHLNSKSKAIEINSKNKRKMTDLNNYIMQLSEVHFNLDKFGYALKRRKKLQLKINRWREYRRGNKESVLKCLHLKKQHQTLALGSLINQLFYRFYETKIAIVVSKIKKN